MSIPLDRNCPRPHAISAQPERSVLKSNTPLKPYTLAAGDSVKVIAVGIYPRSTNR